MRRAMVALLFVGFVAGHEPGTLASFSAEIDNEGELSTGTIVLSNKRNNATACLSTGGGTTDGNANDCDVLFTLANQDGGTSNVRVTLAHEGTIDASSLQLFWADGTTPCTTVDDPSATYHGTGDLCDLIRLQVQEYPDLTAQTGNDRTNGYCWFGGGAGTNSCSNNNNFDLAAFDAYDGSSVIDMGPTSSNTTRYFRIYVNTAAGQLANTVQGRMVEFGFTWRLVQ